MSTELSALTLVTGANSRLARAIIDVLPAGLAVRAIDTRFDTPLPARVETRSGDLRDADETRAALDGVETLLHLAPLSAPFDDDLSNLDHAMRGTYQVLNIAQAKGVAHVVVGSSLSLFDTFPPEYGVASTWRPRPRATVPDLCAWLAEVLAREGAREASATFTCLRLARTLSAGEVAAVVEQVTAPPHSDWRVLHIGARTSQATPSRPAASGRAISKVVIFGAGGPLAAAAAHELKDDYILRLTDIRPIPEIVAANAPQSAGAPLPEVPEVPHEWRVVDVTDSSQVTQACEGMDAIINCTVIRHDLEGAFRVNAVGAYNIMHAAVEHGIRRVVHTGPFQIGREGAAGYNWDTLIVDDVPARPGGYWNLYFHSKLLGQEICRIFAEQYSLEVPALLFNDFVNPGLITAQTDNVFFVSWSDAGRAIRAALETTALPSPFEILHINADLPHGVFPNDKAKRVLGWKPVDNLDQFWTHP